MQAADNILLKMVIGAHLHLPLYICVSMKYFSTSPYGLFWCQFDQTLFMHRQDRTGLTTNHNYCSDNVKPTHASRITRWKDSYVIPKIAASPHCSICLLLS